MREAGRAGPSIPTTAGPLRVVLLSALDADGGAVHVSVGGESDSAMVAPLDQALRIRRAGGRLIVVSGSLALDRLSALLGLDRLMEPVDRPPGAADAAAVGARATAPEQTRPMLISA